MFKDQSFLTKISLKNRMPTLNKSFNNIGATERNNRNHNKSRIDKNSFDHLPQIKEVTKYKSNRDRRRRKTLTLREK